ncbi:hypothetical protein TNCV_1875271 [Trichonephila clavipes]|nr:hypothetical protein TNCV_1875271 [Trichonephila clavipes]
MLIEVSDVIREKCKKEFRRKVVLFHQDNVQPHHVSADDQLDALHPEVGFDATSTTQARYNAFVLLSVFTFVAAS